MPTIELDVETASLRPAIIATRARLQQNLSCHGPVRCCWFSHTRQRNRFFTPPGLCSLQHPCLGFSSIDKGKMSGRVHSPGLAGVALDAHKTAVVFIEYQNEFATEGGKLHDAVKGTMGDMLGSSAAVAEAARAAGTTVMHAPISFKEDASDNPNKGVGILQGCAENKFFTEGRRKLG
mgnify:CR=1 FL=1